MTEPDLCGLGENEVVAWLQAQLLAALDGVILVTPGSDAERALVVRMVKNAIDAALGPAEPEFTMT